MKDFHNPAPKIAALVQEYKRLQQAEGFLLQLTEFRKKSTPNFTLPGEVQRWAGPHPRSTILEEVLNEYERLHNCHRTLVDWVYGAGLGPYEEPPYLSGSEEGSKLWRQIHEFFGFDDSE